MFLKQPDRGVNIRKSVPNVELLSGGSSQCYQPTNKCHNTSCENELGCNKSCAAIITLAKSPAARLP